MMSMKKLVCVLTVAAGLGGIGLASAQSLPSNAPCIANCGSALGECASGAAQGNSECVDSCTRLGRAAAGCAQACAAGTVYNIGQCKATFADVCVANCSNS
jgi:hypothetical protein